MLFPDVHVDPCAGLQVLQALLGEFAISGKALDIEVDVAVDDIGMLFRDKPSTRAIMSLMWWVARGLYVGLWTPRASASS
jgi:hypothetical protein